LGPGCHTGVICSVHSAATDFKVPRVRQQTKATVMRCTQQQAWSIVMISLQSHTCVWQLLQDFMGRMAASIALLRPPLARLRGRAPGLYALATVQLAPARCAALAAAAGLCFTDDACVQQGTLGEGTRTRVSPHCSNVLTSALIRLRKGTQHNTRHQTTPHCFRLSGSSAQLPSTAAMPAFNSCRSLARHTDTCMVVSAAAMAALAQPAHERLQPLYHATYQNCYRLTALCCCHVCCLFPCISTNNFRQHCQ
jgi:hypothetical protein